MMRVNSTIAFALAVTACSSTREEPRSPMAAPRGTVTVVSVDDVEWEQLNPARGAQSPRAGTLWGDRNGEEATGFLLRPVDGFESPPHIHNVSYRGVVIHGVIHNDDPAAEKEWMPAGSFWTQPRGAVHITAAQGTNTLAYIEIDEGPYLVHPPAQQFETEEQSVNIDVAKVNWLEPPSLSWLDAGARAAVLWGAPTDAPPSGTLLELAAESQWSLGSTGPSLRAVVVGGTITHQAPDAVEAPEDSTTLEPGGYFASTGAVEHRLACDSTEACVIYVRAEGALRLRRGS